MNKNIVEYCKKKERYQVFYEVPFMSRIIDIVLIDYNRIITFELKLKSWKKAIEQMKEHRLGSDFLYLVMPNTISKRTIKKIKPQLVNFGFGFMLWNDNKKSIKEIIRAEQNDICSEMGKIKLKDNCVQIRNILKGEKCQKLKKTN